MPEENEKPGWRRRRRKRSSENRMAKMAAARQYQLIETSIMAATQRKLNIENEKVSVGEKRQ
jgi:hypothetical protein